MYLKERESKILIMKKEVDWEGENRPWPPEGIELKFDHLPERLQTSLKI